MKIVIGILLFIGFLSILVLATNNQKYNPSIVLPTIVPTSTISPTLIPTQTSVNPMIPTAIACDNQEYRSYLNARVQLIAQGLLTQQLDQNMYQTYLNGRISCYTPYGLTPPTPGSFF